jgi:hypothetical protein
MSSTAFCSWIGVHMCDVPVHNWGFHFMKSPSLLNAPNLFNSTVGASDHHFFFLRSWLQTSLHFKMIFLEVLDAFILEPASQHVGPVATPFWPVKCPYPITARACHHPFTVTGPNWSIGLGPHLIFPACPGTLFLCTWVPPPSAPSLSSSTGPRVIFRVWFDAAAIAKSLEL